MNHLLILFYLFFATCYSLSCYQGTNANNNVCVASSGQHCIKADLLTPTSNGSATEVFACGDCTTFQGAEATFANVQCCDSADLCHALGTPPTGASCGAISDMGSCTSRSDCYWCSNSIFGGVGICKELGNYSAPCFSVPLAFQELQVCGSVDCQVPTPAYTAGPRFTKKFLNDFGFPSLSGLTLVSFAADVYSRKEVRSLSNNITNFCLVDDEMEHWCGVNHSYFPLDPAFSFCLISERWPQPDLWGWIQNTTITTNTGFFVIFPAFCACPKPGRGYYIPVPRVFVVRFGPACWEMHTMLAFYIMVSIVTLIVLLIILWDLVVVYILNSDRSKETRKKGGTAGLKMIIVKILIVLYCLVTIPSQCLLISPYDIPTHFVATLILRLLGIEFLIYAFCVAVFSYVELILESGVFGKHKNKVASLHFFKWSFLLFNTFFLFSAVVLTSAFGYYTQYIQEIRFVSLADLSEKRLINAGLIRTVILILVSVQFLSLIVAAVLLPYITYLMYIYSDFKKKHIKGLVVRVCGLIFGLIVSVPNLAILCVLCWMLAWIGQSTTYSPQGTEYRYAVVFRWIVLGQYMSELLLVGAIAFSMRTKVDKTWLFTILAGKFGSSKSGISGSSATFSYRSQAERSMNDMEVHDH